MKKIKVLFVLWLLFSNILTAQHPSNDLNWQLIPTHSEDFSGNSINPIWMNNMWYAGIDETKDYVCLLDNLTVTNDIGNFTLKKDFKFMEWQVWNQEANGGSGGYEIKRKTFPFTYSIISTGRSWPPSTTGLNPGTTYTYGYFESKLKLPTYNKDDCYGEINFGWWMYERSGSNGYNLDWIEIDFFEILTNGTQGPFKQQFTCNTHVIKPFDYDEFEFRPWYRDYAYNQMNDLDCLCFLLNDDYPHDPTYPCGGDELNWQNLPKPYANQAFTWNSLVDPQHVRFCDQYTEYMYHPNNRPTYKALYESTGIDDQWHTFGCEWLPDQIKFYIDGKLHFRLEGDFRYDYTDIYGIPQALYPIKELILPLPMIMGFHPGMGYEISATNCPPLTMQVEYINYYQLKKDCDEAESLIFPSYNFLNHQATEHKVYNTIILGELNNSSASAEINLGRKSLRAKVIKFEDGFKVDNEGELYAHDVDCNKLP